MALPEHPVGGALSVVDVVEEDLQLPVVIEVGGDDRANRRGSGEAPAGDVLKRRAASGAGRSNTQSCPPVSPHPECRVGALQEKPVGAVPVSVDDVRLPVAVEVGQRHPSAVLIRVGHTFTRSHSCETLLQPKKTEYGGFMTSRITKKYHGEESMVSSS